MRKAMVISTILLLLLSTLLISRTKSETPKTQTSPPSVGRALIVQGYYDFYPTAYFVKWTLENVWRLERYNIRYLTAYYVYNPPSWVDFDDYATYDNVRYYIREWLGKYNGPTLLYFVSHGGGHNETDLGDGRWDDNGDEGPEHYVDGMWRGADECILLENSTETNPPWKYWDDELKEDLAAFTRPMITVVLQACRPENETSELGCHSGGFIDDLSNVSSRTIITSSSEIGYSYYNRSDQVYSQFTYHYFNAFANYKIIYEGPYTHFNYSAPNDWPYKTLRGAFGYALQHDQYYLSGCEHPWLEDEGDGLPTYRNGSDIQDFPWNDWEMMRWLIGDVTYNGIVDMTDIGIAAQAYGSTPGKPNWNKMADVIEDWQVDMNDIGWIALHYGQ